MMRGEEGNIFLKGLAKGKAFPYICCIGPRRAARMGERRWLRGSISLGVTASPTRGNILGKSGGMGASGRRKSAKPNQAILCDMRGFGRQSGMLLASAGGFWSVAMSDRAKLSDILNFYLDLVRYTFRDPWDDVSGDWAKRIDAERIRLWGES